MLSMQSRLEDCLSRVTMFDGMQWLEDRVGSSISGFEIPGYDFGEKKERRWRLNTR